MERRQKVEREKNRPVGGGRGIDGDGVIWKDGRNYQAPCVCARVRGMLYLNERAGCEAERFSGFTSLISVWLIRFPPFTQSHSLLYRIIWGSKHAMTQWTHTQSNDDEMVC